jgi:hypothetical protein
MKFEEFSLLLILSRIKCKIVLHYSQNALSVLISLVHISQSLQITESPEHIEHNQFIDSKKYIIYRDFAYIIETKSVVNHIFLCCNLFLMNILIYVTNYLYMLWIFVRLMHQISLPGCTYIRLGWMARKERTTRLG